MFDFIKKLFSPVIWFLDFVTKYFKTIVFLTIVYFLFFSSNDEELMSNNFANLQKIDLIGEIVDPTK
ncbi:MAG: signal peptide peptidase SppA, partial [Aliarcobacter sp.]